MNLWLKIRRLLNTLIGKIKARGSSSPSIPFLPDPFFGYVDLNGKNNFQVNFRIDRNGANTMRARLSVANKHDREMIIAIHFLKYLSQVETPGRGFEFSKRDEPWDFQIKAGDAIFNIEITAVSDNENQFIWLNDQDKIGGLMRNGKPSDDDFKRVKKHANSDFLEKIRKEKEEGSVSPRVIVTNLTPMGESFKDVVLAAIRKKAEKKHTDKDITILLIENRISHITPEDVLNLKEQIRLEMHVFPFPEVWFYTGCFSDDDGNNAAFALHRLK